MINIQRETLIPIRKVCDWCEKHIGNRVHVSTVQRWRQRGVRGVILETFLVGGNRFTSIEALQRFFAASTAAADQKINPVVEIDNQPYEQAENFLKSEGI